MRFAYADPPYLGQGTKHYARQHENASAWDSLEAHAALVDRLTNEYPDGWALSLSTPSLRDLLPLCPKDVRVMAWVKPFAIYKPNVNPAYAWEPVIVHGGRRRGRDAMTVKDWVSANITLERGVVGAKPQGFCVWLFEILGAHPEDDFDDLFPGSGAVSKAWDAWKRQQSFLRPEREVEVVSLGLEV